jgi:hypothetical protein
MRPPSRRPSGVDDIPLTLTPTNEDVLRIAAAAEQAVADGLNVESDSHKPQPAARLPRINGERALEAFHLPLREERIETAHSNYVTESPVN